MMLIFLMKIYPPASRRREVLDILKSVRGPTSVKPGCLACEICEGVGDDQAILYLEQWKSAAELHYHIQSVIYSRLLATMDLSTIQPEVQFYEIGQVYGMELIESLRTQPRVGD